MENVFPEDEQFIDSCPETVRKLIQAIGIIPPPPDAPVEVGMVYDRAYHARCMVCTSKLGENTMLSFNAYGIFMTACGGVCLSDYHVMQWMQEQYDDLIEKAKFRGGAGEIPLDADVSPEIDDPRNEEDLSPSDDESEEESNGEVK